MIDAIRSQIDQIQVDHQIYGNGIQWLQPEWCVYYTKQLKCYYDFDQLIWDNHERPNA